MIAGGIHGEPAITQVFHRWNQPMHQGGLGEPIHMTAFGFGQSTACQDDIVITRPAGHPRRETIGGHIDGLGQRGTGMRKTTAGPEAGPAEECATQGEGRISPGPGPTTAGSEQRPHPATMAELIAEHGEDFASFRSRRKRPGMARIGPRRAAFAGMGQAQKDTQGDCGEFHYFSLNRNNEKQSGPVPVRPESGDGEPRWPSSPSPLLLFPLKKCAQALRAVRSSSGRQSSHEATAS